jgi:hypothetical protein
MGKEIGASYLPVRPNLPALRSLQHKPFPIRQVVEIRGGFDILSSNTVLSSSFIQPSQMSTSDVESGTDLPSSSNSALPDQERHTKRIVSRNGVREFLVIEYAANVRKNTKISAIWHHGGERRRLDDHSMERYWRYAYYEELDADFIALAD